MTTTRDASDPLSQWLVGERLSTLDSLLGEALDVIVVIDRDLNVRYINWTSGGLRRDDVIGGSAVDIVPPEHREAVREAYEGVLRTGRGTQLETLFRVGEDLFLWDVRVGPIRADGEVVGLIVRASDVTEQHRAGVDRERFFSLSLDMLVVVSPSGHFKRVNPAFGETLGYEMADLVGRSFVEFVHPDDRARTLEASELGLRTGRVLDFENRYLRSDGEYRVFAWRGIVDPVTRDVYAVARDITDHRATEAQLRHAQKMEAVGQLAGGVAHDFNNLLQAILANTELVRQSSHDSEALAEHLLEIEGAAQRAAGLTKRLLAFSRRQSIRPIPVDLNQLTRGLLKMLRRLLPESITVEFIPGHNLAFVNADPSQLEQVIVNLCVNARDAMEKGGRLTIATENASIDAGYCKTHPWAKPGRYVLLTVADVGVGMTPNVRERVFEPFFTTKGPKGTGLGLATVYGVVQQHEGLIQVDSEPGVGTTFRIYLPAAARAIAPGASGEAETIPPPGRETILVVEDEARVRRAVVQILERAGYHVIAASNGLEAIHTLEKYDGVVHLLLLDVVMPELGGPETWDRVKRLREGLRVLFTSGYADEQYRKLLPPDAEVLDKPFRAERLLKRVRKLLEG